MNLFNEAIYSKHLEHSQKGQTWGKHKYLYITETGRYVYPEDIANGKSASQFRSQQINDQIRSAHSNATSSSMRLTPGSELKKRAEARAAAKVSATAVGSKSAATNTANRNTVTIKSDEKKEETTTSKDGEKYKNMSEETKAWLMKGGDKEKKESTNKGSGGSKKKGSSKKSSSSKSSSKASTKTEEANKMGLSDDDLKNMEVNTQATNRDEVLKNIALRVIRGDYGNGADRKAKLGNYYDEVQKRVNELTSSGQIQRPGQTTQQVSQKTEEKKEQSTSTSAPQNNTSQKTVSSSNNQTTKTKAKAEFNDVSDEDFEKKATRLGNTDFHYLKRDDGKYEILEEDMKWVVDEKPSSKMIKNLEAMEDFAKRARKNNVRYGTKDWERMASDAINGKDFTNENTGRNLTTKNYQDQTRKYRTNDQIRSAHQGATKEKEGVLYTRRNDGRYIGKKRKIKHSDMEGDFLMHWGKKHRSGRFKFGSGSRPYQHEARNHSWRDRRTMTDEDLDKALTRARKENDLYNAERNNRSQTQKFIEDVLQSVGKTILIDAGKGAIKYTGRQFVLKALENEDLADAMFGGGGKKKKKK